MAKKTKDAINQDRADLSAKASEVALKKRYKEALKTIDQLNKEKDSILAIKDTVTIHKIETKKQTDQSEATSVWLASDWHVDEVVDGATINMLNHYTAPIANKRAKNFFTSGLRLTNILAQDVSINTIVLALLGDFYTGHIHPDFMEITDTQPIHAVIRVQNMIASGIQYILDNSKYNLVLPCHSGN